MVRYTIVLHCIDTARVRTRESDRVQFGAVGYMIVCIVCGGLNVGQGRAMQCNGMQESMYCTRRGVFRTQARGGTPFLLHVAQ